MVQFMYGAVYVWCSLCMVQLMYGAALTWYMRNNVMSWRECKGRSVDGYRDARRMN